jgi:hypothetical protein
MVHEKVYNLGDCFIPSRMRWAAGARCWRYTIRIIVQSAISMESACSQPQATGLYDEDHARRGMKVRFMPRIHSSTYEIDLSVRFDFNSVRFIYS